jgi:predicted membrane protein
MNQSEMKQTKPQNLFLIYLIAAVVTYGVVTNPQHAMAWFIFGAPVAVLLISAFSLIRFFMPRR